MRLSSTLFVLEQEANRRLVDPHGKQLLNSSGSLLTYLLQGFLG